MTSVLRSMLLALTAVSVVSTLSAAPASAEPLKLKLVLNWKYQGPQGMFFLAQDRGYYKDEGLEVTLDQGNGSGAAVPLVANGTYDVGFGDINALIEFAAKKPEEAPIAVYVMFNQPPFTVAVKADSPIKAPKDFEGKTIGGAANDGALKLFPAFCKITKIDCSKVNITNMQPNLREQMLMQGQVDGVFGYVRQADGRSGQPDSLHQVWRLRHGPLFERHHRLQEACQRESEGRRGSCPSDQQRRAGFLEGH
jgi:NitT/TauT family transport system substrate-binding protein